MSSTSGDDLEASDLQDESFLLPNEDEEVPGEVNETNSSIDDDLALLAIAKQRLAQQQVMEESRRYKGSDLDDAPVPEGANGDDEEELEDDDEFEGEGDEEDSEEDNNESEEDHIASNSSKMVQETSSELLSPDSKLPGRDKMVSFEEKKDEPTRRQRDENAELWDLLRQSKHRIQSTRNLIVEESDSHLSMNLSTEEDDIAPQGVQATPGVAKTKEELRDEERKRKFQNENRELWILLQKSKNRLEEAAKAKMREASKAEAANVVTPAPIVRIENPYKEIDAVPDEAESEDALTQKELLLAMAVAEEASRSGKECFATPSRAELRTRDIRSFEFIKKEFGEVPETPIGNDEKEEERERNRFTMLTQTLSNQWASFRVQLGDLDISQRLPRLGSKS